MLNTIYYIETNMTCFLVLAILLWQHRQRVDNQSQIVASFDLIIMYTMALCISDMLSGVWNGMPGQASRIVIEISNLFYFGFTVLVSFQWANHVCYVFRKTDDLTKVQQWLWSTPLIVFILILASNPVTNFVFSIDANNLYVRGDGVFVHWIVSWLYFAIAILLTVAALIKEPSKARRRELTPFIYFVIAPVFGTVAQMAFYGVTSIQVGITLSILLLYLFDQNREILSDPLTGLNNRRHMERYFSRNLQADEALDLFVIMIDLNSFKQINDTYGHTVGDRALCEAADVLRATCGNIKQRVLLCRYGGDEFVIAGTQESSADAQTVCEALQHEISKKNDEHEGPYHLSFSAGTAMGACNSMNDVEDLLAQADVDMYEHKKSGRVFE